MEYIMNKLYKNGNVDICSTMYGIGIRSQEKNKGVFYKIECEKHHIYAITIYGKIKGKKFPNIMFVLLDKENKILTRRLYGKQSLFQQPLILNTGNNSELTIGILFLHFQKDNILLLNSIWVLSRWIKKCILMNKKEVKYEKKEMVKEEKKESEIISDLMGQIERLSKMKVEMEERCNQLMKDSKEFHSKDDSIEIEHVHDIDLSESL